MKEYTKIQHFMSWLFLGRYLPLDDKYNLRCSRCRAKMRKVKKGDIVIDVCDNCGGLFLDDGEIEKLIELNKKSKSKDKAKSSVKKSKIVKKLRNKSSN